ncbi:gamma-mobile-trio protein GmtX, partial [Endozoicomonas sp.]|uniref:gamma-mobile-trio protein GmtX n=1 Tax=Endozoicomonas sp. TaxID=1892382 RepID=UPI00383B8ABC
MCIRDRANTSTKKPLAEKSRSRHVPTDNKLLERITDPALRALFGQIIAERNRYRKEVNILKQHANVVIDKRPVRQFEAQAKPSVEVLPSLSGLLTASEVKAIQFAVSDECMEKHNWQTTQAGQVKEMEYNSEIFPRGFVTGLHKLLSEVSDGER